MARLRDLNARINFESNADEVAREAASSLQSTIGPALSALAVGFATQMAAQVAQSISEAVAFADSQRRSYFNEVGSIRREDGEDAVTALTQQGFGDEAALAVARSDQFALATDSDPSRVVDEVFARLLKEGIGSDELNPLLRAAGIQDERSLVGFSSALISGADRAGVSTAYFAGELRSQLGTQRQLGLNAFQSIEQLADVFETGAEVSPFQSVNERLQETAQRLNLDPLQFSQGVFNYIRTQPITEGNLLAEQVGVDPQYLPHIRSGQLGYGEQLSSQFNINEIINIRPNETEIIEGRQQTGNPILQAVSSLTNLDPTGAVNSLVDIVSRAIVDSGGFAEEVTITIKGVGTTGQLSAEDIERNLELNANDVDSGTFQNYRQSRPLSTG